MKEPSKQYFIQHFSYLKRYVSDITCLAVMVLCIMSGVGLDKKFGTLNWASLNATQYNSHWTIVFCSCVVLTVAFVLAGWEFVKPNKYAKA